LVTESQEKASKIGEIKVLEAFRPGFWSGKAKKKPPKSEKLKFWRLYGQGLAQLLGQRLALLGLIAQVLP
jgi:hypothetical protein